MALSIVGRKARKNLFRIRPAVGTIGSTRLFTLVPMPRRLPGFLVPSRAVIRSAPRVSRQSGAVWIAFGVLAASVVLTAVWPRTPAFREDPDFATRPAYRAAMALASAGQYVEAADAFGALAERERNSSLGAWSRYQQGICMRAAGRRPEARSAFERTARDYPRLHLASAAGEAILKLAGARETSPVPSARLDPHCGPRCLLFVCQRRGIPATLPELVRRCRTGADGTTMGGLSRAARHKGLRPEGLWVTTAELGRVALPAIVWVDRNHYLVVTRLDGDRVEYYDPALEAAGPRQTAPASAGTVRTSSLDEFDRRWDGYVLALGRDPQEKLR